MRLQKIDYSNIECLYTLTKELAHSENQSHLFTASLQNFERAFLGTHPSAFAFLLNHEAQNIGFVIFTYKFASYLGSKTFYIEDIYIKEKNQSLLSTFLKQLRVFAQEQGCCRVEMRVLKKHNIGLELLEQHHFEKIKKWHVYRLEC